jgi:hypothetical protein
MAAVATVWLFCAKDALLAPVVNNIDTESIVANKDT